jgi:hypothetical protein
VESSCERIACDSENVPMVCLDGLAQDSVMLLQDRIYFIRVFLRQDSAALDVGE